MQITLHCNHKFCLPCLEFQVKKETNEKIVQYDKNQQLISKCFICKKNFSEHDISNIVGEKAYKEAKIYADQELERQQKALVGNSLQQGQKITFTPKYQINPQQSSKVNIQFFQTKNQQQAGSQQKTQKVYFQKVAKQCPFCLLDFKEEKIINKLTCAKCGFQACQNCRLQECICNKYKRFF